MDNNQIKAKEYWRQVMEEMNCNFSLPYDFELMDGYNEMQYFFQLDDGLIQKIVKRMQGNTILEYSVFYAAMHILFYKITGCERIHISSPVTTENRYNRFLPSSCPVMSEMTLREVVENANIAIKKGYHYQFFPLDEVMDINEYRNYETQMKKFLLYYSELHSEAQLLEFLQTNQNEFTIALSQSDDRLQGKIYFNGFNYDLETVKCYIDCYLMIVNQIMDDLDVKVKELSFYRKSMQNDIDSIEDNIQVLQIYDETLKEKKESLALVEGNEAISYESLEQFSNQIAYQLSLKYLEEGTAIGIIAQSSIYAVASMLAVMKLGLVFILINPAGTEQYLFDLIKDSKCKYVLSDMDEINVGKIPVLMISNDESNEIEKINYAVTVNETIGMMYSYNEKGKLYRISVTQEQMKRGKAFFLNDIGYEDGDGIALSIAFLWSAPIWVLYFTYILKITVYLVPNEIITNEKEMNRYVKKYSINTVFGNANWIQNVINAEVLQIKKAIVVCTSVKDFSYDVFSNHIVVYRLFEPYAVFPMVGLCENEKQNGLWMQIKNSSYYVKCEIDDIDHQLVEYAIPGELIIDGEDRIHTGIKARKCDGDILQIYWKDHVAQDKVREIRHSKKEDSNQYNVVEEQVTLLFEELLGKKVVDKKLKFLELGGNSILIMRLVAELNQLYQNIIKVSDIYAYSSITTLTDYIVSKLESKCEVKNVNMDLIHETAVVLSDEYYNLSSIDQQKTMMFQLTPECSNQMNKITKEMNITVSTFILSIYVYVFLQVTKQEKIYIHSILDEEHNVGVIEGKYESLQQIGNFIHEIDQQVKKKIILYQLDSLEQLLKMTEGKNDLIFFYDTSLYHYASQIQSIYSFVLGVKEIDCDDVRIVCRWNHQRINSEKAKELFSIVINCIEEIMK